VYNCKNKFSSKGFCIKHIRRFIRHGTTDRLNNDYRGKKCIIKGCKFVPKRHNMCHNHDAHIERIKLKKQLFNILGGSTCVKCGFNDERALQFEHKNGGGSKEHKKFKSSMVYYIYYVNNPKEAKRKLQVYCANCNWIKRVENDEVQRKYVKIN
jgi:hypothetical protein